MEDVVFYISLMKIQLLKLAHARSGDKGDTANVGLIALRPEFYPLLVREVTAARVKEHFKGICKGDVERFELPNLGALNFLLHHSLGGGGTLSMDQLRHSRSIVRRNGTRSMQPLSNS